MPAEYFERPVLFDDLRDTIEMFFDLTGSRPINFGGPGAIPVSEIHAYFEMFGITDHLEKQLFLRRIRLLDETFLRYHQDKRQQDNGSSGNKNTGAAVNGGKKA
jgi:hypothetical protein